MSSGFIQNLQIHNDWKPFLTREIKSFILKTESEIVKGDYTPSNEKVLRFFELPLHSVKVVILGQDPYPQPGIATGRAFEVGTLKSWNEPFKNISLKNILRALYKAYSGEVVKYSDLKTKFDNEFPVLPPNQLFKHWEKEGVLLLNTAFTCEPGKPGSHKLIWEKFSGELLQYIAQNYSRITWFLWGAHALEATRNIKIKKKIVTQHPMMCYDKPGRDTDFLYGKTNCFEQLKNEIDWTGFNLKNGFRSANTLF
ncbi:MAG: uracil-DNA glycosylase [Prolixibacteraceae bacterium]|nr:uracil-DNA glycosylase [Prolixibacteraceae bacterium]